MRRISKTRSKFGLHLTLVLFFLLSGANNLSAQIAPYVGDLGYGGIVVAYNDTSKVVLVMSLDEEKDKRWEEGAGWVKGYKFDNYKDWRLPELSELIQIYENQEDLDDALARSSYPILSKDYYWSSAEYRSYNAWYVRVGIASTGEMGKAPRYRTRAVRTFNLETGERVIPPKTDEKTIRSASGATPRQKKIVDTH